MTLSLWMLLGFASWTLVVLLFGVGVRRWLLIFKGQAALTSFPGDQLHGSPAYRRATRAHVNCIENLPVFAAIVLTAAVAHLDSATMGALAAAVLGCRIVQTTVHLSLAESNGMVAVRFSFFLLQVIAMIAMLVLLITAALGSPGSA
jgi:uncharacterized MAPEG superfamily protein